MRNRIVGLTVLAAALAIVLFGVPLALGVARYYSEDERGELERLADASAVGVADDLIRGADPTVLPRSAPDTDIALFDQDGRLVLGAGPKQADPRVRTAIGGSVSSGDTGDEIVVAVPVFDSDRVIGVIRAATSRREVFDRTVETWLLMIGLGAVALTLTWLVARRQAARLAHPLEDLSEAARRLGQGDFSARAHPAGVPEIDSVSTSLNETAERLGALLARERAFSADASHQLRTPLTGLRLSLEAAQGSPNADPLEAIRAALTSADLLEGTITDLLALARDSHHRADPADIDELLAEIHAHWHGSLATQGRPLRVERLISSVRLTASSVAVRQIMTVLLDNAMQHGSGTVTVTAREATSALAVDVVDEGAGVQASEDELFARRSGQPDGHGIGLALARTLAEAEGGRLRLSQPRPPRFTLLLPLDQTEVSSR